MEPPLFLSPPFTSSERDSALAELSVPQRVRRRLTKAGEENILLELLEPMKRSCVQQASNK